MNEIELCIMANCPLLYVVSPEENRFIKEIENICIKHRRKLWIHSISTGLYNIAFSNMNKLGPEKIMGRMQDGLKDPIALLEYIKKRNVNEGIFLLLDFHPFRQTAAAAPAVPLHR